MNGNITNFQCLKFRYQKKIGTFLGWQWSNCTMQVFQEGLCICIHTYIDIPWIEVVTVIRLVNNPKCRFFFLEPKGVSPNVTPPRKKGTITINHYDPISKALFPGVALGGGFDIRFRIRCGCPVSSLGKDEFPQGFFLRYGVLKKKRVLLPQFCWKASNNCGIQYTPHGVGIFSRFQLQDDDLWRWGGCPKKTLIYIYIYKFLA